MQSKTNSYLSEVDGFFVTEVLIITIFKMRQRILFSRKQHTKLTAISSLSVHSWRTLQMSFKLSNVYELTSQRWFQIFVLYNAANMRTSQLKI